MTPGCLPGGRCELLEPATGALRREMREELGVEIQVERLVWVVENFFEHDGKSNHELGFYFLMTFPNDRHLNKTDEPFRGDEEGMMLIFKWFQPSELDKIPLYPTFLQESLNSIPEVTEHIIHRDGKE